MIWIIKFCNLILFNYICAMTLHEAFEKYEIRYFTCEEFTASRTAMARSICNVPTSPRILLNLFRLGFFMGYIRDLAGSPIRISSGYRSIALNRAVGGVPQSRHLIGCAVDILHTTNYGQIYELVKPYARYINNYKDRGYFHCDFTETFLQNFFNTHHPRAYETEIVIGSF